MDESKDNGKKFPTKHSIFFNTGDTYLTIVDYQTYGTRKIEMYLSDDIIISYIHKRRIQRECETGILFSVTTYMLDKLIVEEFKHTNFQGERKGRPHEEVINKRISKRIFFPDMTKHF